MQKILETCKSKSIQK